MSDLSNFFDAGTYAALNPDLKTAGLTTSDQLFNHFQKYGSNEGRQFSLFFDPKYYAANNADLGAAGLKTDIQLLDHFRNYGAKEGRSATPFLDLNLYLTANPDLNQVYKGDRQQALDHLLNFGLKENRRFSPTFDVNYYRDNYSDLKAANITSTVDLLRHYELYGRQEGRISDYYDIKVDSVGGPLKYQVNAAGGTITGFRTGTDVISENVANATANFIDLISPYQPLISDTSKGAVIGVANGAEVNPLVTLTGITADKLADSPQSFNLSSRGNAVVNWNQITFDAARLGGVAPAESTRYFAIVQTAVFDAVQGIFKTPGRQTFLSSLSADVLKDRGVTLPTAPTAGASAEAAVAGAANEALKMMFGDKDNPLSSATFTPLTTPTGAFLLVSSNLTESIAPRSISTYFQTIFDNAQTQSLAKINDSQANINAGVAYGKAVADAILKFRSNDGQYRDKDGTPVSRSILSDEYLNGVENGAGKTPEQLNDQGGQEQLGDPTNHGTNSKLLNTGTVARDFDGTTHIGSGPVLTGGDHNSTNKSTPGVWRRAEDTLGLTGAGIPSGNNALYSGLASIDETNANLTWVVPTTTFFNNNVIAPPALDSERYRGNVAEVKQNGTILDLPITNPNSNGKVYIAHRTTTVNGVTTVVPDDTSFTDGNGNQFIGSYVGIAINDTDPTQPDFGPGDHSNDFGRLQPDGLGTTSAERTLISHIWANDGGSYGPNYSWEDIGRQLAIANKSSLADTALVFAELSQGLSDVFENAWNIKWDRDYFWRPVSSIRGADQIPVGTDSTNQDKIGTSDLVDSNWTPREETPQHPCHPSGSSTTGGDASTILANFYGDSSAAFTVSAAPHPNSSRLREALVSLNGNDLVPVKTATGTVTEHVDSLSKTYTSLREAANDIRTSRIYSGAHFRFATEDGVNLGEQSGSYYVRHNPFVTGVTK